MAESGRRGDRAPLFLEQLAQARDQDTWNELMAPALSGLKCRVIQSTNDEAPGLLAYVEPHLGAHHSPDLFHVQQELSPAVSAPMAPKERAAQKAVTKAKATLERVQERLHPALDEPQPHGPGGPPTGEATLEEAEQAVAAARQEHQRLFEQRQQVAQSIRAIGQAYHFVDLERGVRRGGQLIADDLHEQMGTIRTVAQQEGLSQTCLDRIDQAERVVPKMQATIEFVSGYGQQQVSQLDLTPPVSFALHARLLPSFYLERVA